MTCEKIVQALEWYIRQYSRGVRIDDNVRIGDILDLINRLQAEKQSLKYDYDNLQRQFEEIYQQFHYLSSVEIPYLYSFTEDKDKKLETIANILLRTKTEAYKEFAEKANEIIDLIVDLMFDGNVSKCQLPSCHKPSSISCESKICIQENKEYWHSKLDNLLNELVGDNNGKDL